jgi:hypothetical protein
MRDAGRRACSEAGAAAAKKDMLREPEGRSGDAVAGWSGRWRTHGKGEKCVEVA